MEPIVEFKNITMEFPGVRANDDVSLSIQKGEIFALVGENGAGKSTFLNLMTGVLQADSGKIERGETLRIGYYRQSGISFKPGQTVFDIVHDIAETVEASDGHSVSATTMLNRFLFPHETFNKRVDILSGGEKRRLYLLIVLMQNPNPLILDEPTAGLDPKGRDEILDQVKKLREETNMTVVLVSHSMEDVAKYVGRIIVMNQGEVMYDGTPKEVFSHYKELESVGLAAPQVTYIMNALADKGFDVGTDATTIEEATEEIFRVYQKR